jgi:hypothetical protein
LPGSGLLTNIATDVTKTVTDAVTNAVVDPVVKVAADVVLTATGTGGNVKNKLDAVSHDPNVIGAVDDFKQGLKKGATDTVNELSNTLKQPVEETATLLGEAAANAGLNGAMSVPVIGAGVAAVTTAANIMNTVKDLKDQGDKYVDAIQAATRPAQEAMQNVTKVTDAVRAATNDAVVGATNAAVVGATNAAVAGVNDAAKSTIHVGVPPNVVMPKVKAIAPAAPAAGGSRKRRRIHKLSRRIERTLRRVQKKYGLRDDKNSFLRRTINAQKMK